MEKVLNTSNLFAIAFKALKENGCDCGEAHCLACVCETALMDMQAANVSYKYALRGIAASFGSDITQEEWREMTPETSIKIKDLMRGGS